MLAACEAGEVFALLEARDALDHFAQLYGNVREPWLTRALLLYHARTGSARALDLLARAPDLHAKHLLDALLENLRGEAPSRAAALAALAPLVARRPPWLHCLPTHPLARELMRVAPRERDVLPLLHALLALAALLPAEPALATAHWSDLADALLRPATLDPPPSPPARAHLQLAQLALFHALYATYPCTLVETLRAECAGGAPREAWERGLAPLLRGVRLHPALVTGSRQREAEAARRPRLDHHDAFPAQLRDRSDERPPASPSPASVVAPVGSGVHAARSTANMRPGTEPWFALADRCGAESAPNTPLPAEADATEPPEAAVEATPENTPAKETRAQFRYPTESTAVRAIGRRSQPPSPLRKETSPPAGADAYAGKLARVALERRAAESPVPFGGGPPAGALARPEPSRATPAADAEPLNVEDREVLELTQRARAEPAWSGAEERWPQARDPRAEKKGGARGRSTEPARRALSCGPKARGCSSVAVQTVDVWPAPFEFLIADFYRSLPDEECKQVIGGKSDGPVLPCQRLDDYLARLYSGRAATPCAPSAAAPSATYLAEQLALVHAQLMYERWRREAHAERNRRLLGRCRQARALELQNAALHDRLRAAAAERERLLARAARPPPPTAPAPGERELRLEAALAEESAARLRAEAALHESEERRASDAAELRKARGESFEAARHVEALARAALAAERRAEHVRRLRRELLALAEREARARACGPGCAPGAAEAARAAAEESALRTALARAEAEAEASSGRADAATARALELETTLAARDAAVAELKRASKHAGDEQATRLRSLQNRCEALSRALRATETRRLERLAGEAEAGGPSERAERS